MRTTILTANLSVDGMIRRMLKSSGMDQHTKCTSLFDELSFGPLLNTRDPSAFSAVRNKYWEQQDAPFYDPFLFEDYLTPALESNAIEFWVTPMVQDQFFLITLLHFLRCLGIEHTKIWERRFEIKTAKMGLGGHKEAELKAALANNLPTQIDVALYEDAWNAISSNSPKEINSFCGKAPQNHPVSMALQAYLQRFPEFNGGLGSMDRALLAATTDKWRKSGHSVGPAMALGKPDLDSLGDYFLFERLKALEHEFGWVEFRGDTAEMRSCEVKLTKTGLNKIAEFSIQPIR